GRELHALSKSPGNQSRSNDRECHLEAEIDRFWDGRGQAVRRADPCRYVAQYALQERSARAADKSRARRKGKAVGDDRVDDRNETRYGEARHHSVADVLLAHHAAVEQAEAWDGHHQNKCD